MSNNRFRFSFAAAIFLLAFDLSAQTGSIGDLVWSDVDGNGAMDGGDVGIAHVTIDLVDDVNGNATIDAGEAVLATQTTNTSGAYDFTGLAAGDYIIDVTDTNAVLSGSTETTMFGLHSKTLAAGEDYNSADFGYTNLPSSDLSLSKTVSNSTPNLGDNIDFTLTVTNDGPDNATGVTVVDDLPAGLTYVSHSGAGSYASGTGVWTIGTVNNGVSKVITITATANATGITTNVAEITAVNQGDPDSTPANDGGSQSEDDEDNASVTVPTSVPALGEWGLILPMCLLLLAAFYQLRIRNTRNTARRGR